MNSPRYVVIDQLRSTDNCVPVDSFKGWQIQVYNAMGANSWSLTGQTMRVNLVCDTRGQTGKHAFVVSLIHADPGRFLVIYCHHGGISVQDLASEVTTARKKGWSGDSCIVIAILERLDRGSCDALEMAAEGQILVKCDAHFTEYWHPVNIWLFTREMPDLMRSTANIWKIYKMDSEPSSGIPNLQEISFLDGLEMFCRSN